VEDAEIRNIVKFIKQQAGPQYIEEAVETQEKKKLGVEQEKDDLYHEAVRIVVETKQASVSMVQRKLRVGYTRAARMIDIMEEEGIVGPYNGSKPREILIEGIEELEEVGDGDV
jgi:S-DNA-T family DNA segregation ATPase FtsK/SpoIIIE